MQTIWKIARNRRGIALLLVVSVTTILVATALEYNRRARFTLISTAAMRDGITLSQMAASGVHVAMAMLIIMDLYSMFSKVVMNSARSLPTQRHTGEDGLSSDGMERTLGLGIYRAGCYLNSVLE